MVQRTYEPLFGESAGPEVSEATARTTVLGTGLNIWRGTPVAEEYLAQLRPWSKAVKVYMEMQDDAIGGVLMDAIKAPLLAGDFTIVEGGTSNEDLAAAIHLERCLFEMPEMEWLDHVEDTLSMLDFGFAISDKVLDKHSDGRLYLRALIPAGQETLHSWGNELDEFGNVKEFVQQIPQQTGHNTAPMDKLLHFTLSSRKRNPQGKSLFRGIYRPWYFKKNLEVVEAIGAERDVGNMPVAELAEGISISSTDETNLQNALKAMRIDEAAYLITPGGVTIKAFGGGNKVYNVREMIRDYGHLMRQRFFADFLSQGSEGVGTQALAKEMTGFFILALRSIQRKIIAVWTRQLIPYIFRYNRFSINTLPKINWSSPSRENLQSLSQALVQLAGAKLVTADNALEAHIRASFDLPAMASLDEDEIDRETGTRGDANADPVSGVPASSGGDKDTEGSDDSGARK